MVLSNLDMFFDLAIAVPYVVCILYAAFSLWKGKKRDMLKVAFLVLMIAVSLVYLFQVAAQLVLGTASSVRLWDVYNLTQVILNLMAIQFFTRCYGENIKDSYPKLPIL